MAGACQFRLTASPVVEPAGSETHGTAVAERLTRYLADVADAWKAATPAERNRLARGMLEPVVVENRTAVAVMPRPNLRTCFVCIAGGRRYLWAEATGVGAAC